MRWRILNAEPDGYSGEARRILKGFATVDEEPLTPGQLLERIRSYEGLIVRLGHRIDDEVLHAGSNLRFVATATTGLNHVDVEAAAARGIAVISLQGERSFLDETSATPEHTWALLLSLARRIPWAFDDVKRGYWRRDAFRGFELADRVIGILGFGRVGTRLASYARAFDMRVLAADPYVSEGSPPGVELVDLATLLADADVVCVCAALTKETEGMLGPAQFAAMKPGAVLVNTARGEIIDEEALLDALRSNRLRGAALDVLTGEYRPSPTSDRLIDFARSHETLLLSPHIAGATVESMAKTEIFIAQKIEAFAKVRR